MKKKKSFQDRFIKWSGIFLVFIIVFSIGSTVIGKLTKPVIEATVLSVDYVGINESGIRVYRADVEYEYDGEYYTANPEVSSTVKEGDKIKFHIDPERPWDQNGFILYTSSKEVLKVLITVIGVVVIFFIIVKISKKIRSRHS